MTDVFYSWQPAKMSGCKEIFQITQKLSGMPVVYTMPDLLQRLIEGTFYEEELQKIKCPNIFRIEKVLYKEQKDRISCALVWLWSRL